MSLYDSAMNLPNDYHDDYNNNYLLSLDQYLPLIPLEDMMRKYITGFKSLDLLCYKYPLDSEEVKYIKFTYSNN